MHFSIHQSIEAPVISVIETFASPAFYETLSSMANLGTPQVLRHSRSKSQVELDVRYTFTGEISGAARAVIDPVKLTWVAQLRVNLDSCDADLRIVPDHYPDLIKCSGRYIFTATGDATLEVLDAELTVRVPFVGRLVEKAIVDGIRQHLADQAAVMTRLHADAEDQLQ